MYVTVASKYSNNTLPPKRSSNLTSWTTTSIGFDPYDIVFAGGKFVAVGASGKIAYSTNGSSWTQASSPVSKDLLTVAYGGNMFIAISVNGNVMSSRDGITWKLDTTSSDLGASLNSRVSVAYGDDKFVAMNENKGKAVVLSVD